MNISQAASRAGLPVKTLRYYEEIDLIKPARMSNGYRDYSITDVHKLAFLGRARSLGFSVETCRSLLHLYNDKERASADVKQLATTHLDEINAKLVELTEMRDTLSELISACAGNERPDCPILANLSADHEPSKP